jgi:hypothetical protein
LLLQANYAYVSYSSLESIIEQNKQGYYIALRQTQGTIRTESPDWQPWLLFFLRALQQQKRRLSAVAVAAAAAAEGQTLRCSWGSATPVEVPAAAGASATAPAPQLSGGSAAS